MPKQRRVLIEKTVTRRYGIAGADEASAPPAKDVRVKQSQREVRPIFPRKPRRKKPNEDAKNFIKSLEVDR